MSADYIEIKQEGGAECKSAPLFQLTGPSADFLSLFGITPSTSGIIVSPETALGVPAVRNAVSAISQALGQIDANVYAVNGSDNQLAADHPAYALLNGVANPWTSGATIRGQLTFDALLFGNGYAAITRDSDGVPEELTRLNPARMFVLINPDTMEPFYRYSPLDGEQVLYSYNQLLHLRFPSLNGVLGESPIIQGQNAIALAIVMENHAAQLFRNGARPSGIFEHPGKLDAAGFARLRGQVDGAHGGANSGRTLITEQGMKFSALTFSSVDAQFLELRKFALEEIGRIFRVNPVLLGENGRATFANSSEFGRQFISYTLAPWVRLWEDEIALKLFDPAQKGTFRVQLDTDQFDRDAVNVRATGYSAMIAARVMNPNECRALEGLPPYAEGDTFINPNIAAVQENVSLG